MNIAEKTENVYVQLLKEQGNYTINVDGIDWYEYQGFMIPAYLPHTVPTIKNEVAKKVLTISGKPFVRWDSDFDKVGETQWWYILKRGQWDISEVGDKKKRWAIRHGLKNFSTRTMKYDEVLEKCPPVAQSAVKRYKGTAQIEDRAILSKRIQAGKNVPGILEYFGCFKNNRLVSYAESYVQNNGVWWAIIRHDPVYLKDYSSHCLTAGLLEHYLNERKMDYVLDGSRSIHHRTEFQEHLVRVYNFEKCYAKLHILYKPSFNISVKATYPLRQVIWWLASKWTNPLIDNISAVLLQESIRRDSTNIT